ncbi:MAG: NADH-quinone oxidoreductase subunit C [Candidatus Omnitrophota bacterium]
MIKEEVKKRLDGKVNNWFVKNPKRVYFSIAKEDLKEVAKILYFDLNMRLSTVSGVDNEDSFELIYHFGADSTGEMFNVRVFLYDKNNSEIDSLTGMFKASDWIEREIHEMLGVNFIGHPNQKHLLLDEDWPTGNFPLRKSCAPEKKPYPLEEEINNNG